MVCGLTYASLMSIGLVAFWDAEGRVCDVRACQYLRHTEVIHKLSTIGQIRLDSRLSTCCLCPVCMSGHWFPTTMVLIIKLLRYTFGSCMVMRIRARFAPICGQMTSFWPFLAKIPAQKRPRPLKFPRFPCAFRPPLLRALPKLYVLRG